MTYANGPRETPPGDWETRYRAALRRAGGRGEALLTGVAALALYGFRSVPAAADVRVVDVLVPPARRLTPPPGVRIHHPPRRLPPPVRLPPGLPAAPPLRAAVDAVAAVAAGDAVRGVLDRDRTAALLRELQDTHGTPPADLATALRAAALHTRPDVAAALAALGRAVRPPAEVRARAVLRAAALPPPLWRVPLHLDGYWLTTPHAHWPRTGVLLHLAEPPYRDDDGTVDHHNALESMGLHLVHTTPRQLFREPDAFTAAVRDALAAGPYGPADGRLRARPWRKRASLDQVGAEHGESGPRGLRVARVGYDRGQVDAYLGRLESGDEPAGEPVFALVRGGFSTGEVDAYIAWGRRAAEG